MKFFPKSIKFLFLKVKKILIIIILNQICQKKKKKIKVSYKNI
jgi:hypothetical protein